MNEMSTFDLSKIFRQYSSIRRYSTIHTSKDENIAEHSASLALLAIIIWNKLPDNYKNEINIKEISYFAILHDCDEIITGDIPRPTKYSSLEMEESCKQVALQAKKILINSFGEIFMHIDYIEYLLKMESLFLKSIDFLCVLYKCHWEIELGNLDFMDILPELSIYCEKIKNSEIGKYIYENYMKSIIDDLSNNHSVMSHKTNFRLK